MQRLEIETMRGFIYKITNTLNGKVYVGQTIQNIKERFYQHCALKYSKDALKMAIHKAILKYGKQNFSIEVIEEVESENLNEREIYWIKYFNSYKNGYNETLGGQGGNKPFKDINEGTVIQYYKEGKSLRNIGKLLNVDKQTIKNLLLRNNITLRTSRTYKLSQEDRALIMEDINKGVSRIDIINKYNISKSYLSQLINGYRRI